MLSRFYPEFNTSIAVIEYISGMFIGLYGEKILKKIFIKNNPQEEKYLKGHPSLLKMQLISTLFFVLALSHRLSNPLSPRTSQRYLLFHTGLMAAHFAFDGLDDFRFHLGELEMSIASASAVGIIAKTIFSNDLIGTACEGITAASLATLIFRAS